MLGGVHSEAGAVPGRSGGSGARGAGPARGERLLPGAGGSAGGGGGGVPLHRHQAQGAQPRYLHPLGSPVAGYLRQGSCPRLPLPSQLIANGVIPKIMARISMV